MELGLEFTGVTFSFLLVSSLVVLKWPWGKCPSTLLRASADQHLPQIHQIFITFFFQFPLSVDSILRESQTHSNSSTKIFPFYHNSKHTISRKLHKVAANSFIQHIIDSLSFNSLPRNAPKKQGFFFFFKITLIFK